MGDGHMTAKMTISRSFKIEIPKEVRESQNWRPGQELVFIPEGKGVKLVPVPTLDELRGMFRGADPSDYRDRNDRY
jgi:AbrB family looped-hinge helix DNA binding protein